jgi:hypothetical protein
MTTAGFGIEYGVSSGLAIVVTVVIIVGAFAAFYIGLASSTGVICGGTRTLQANWGSSISLVSSP